MLQTVRRGNQLLQAHPLWDLEAVIAAMGMAVDHVPDENRIEIPLARDPLVDLDLPVPAYDRARLQRTAVHDVAYGCEILMVCRAHAT